MGYLRYMTTGLVFVVLMVISTSAQPRLPDPGITPDSPFYFMDRMFDGFQSRESVADERAAEIVAMAQQGHERGLVKAQEGYAKAMEERHQQAGEDENTAEEVTRQASNHLAVLTRVREEVPVKAKAGIDKAINESAKVRENALGALEQRNPERSNDVADSTMQELMANVSDKAQVSEEAQESLQRGLESAKEGRSQVPDPGGTRE